MENTPLPTFLKIIIFYHSATLAIIVNQYFSDFLCIARNILLTTVSSYGNRGKNGKIHNYSYSVIKACYLLRITFHFEHSASSGQCNDDLPLSKNKPLARCCNI